MSRQINNSLVVLGGSMCTKYGLQATRCLVENLSTRGATIISGLETDISILALKTSIDLGGKTIGFLAGSIKAAQRRNQTAQIINKLRRTENGSLFVPKDNLKLGKNPFLSRDKAMISRCSSVLVVEAVIGSRIFHAVEFAHKENKQIFAIPGSIFSYTSRGTSFLLRTGATLVENYEDITRYF